VLATLNCGKYRQVPVRFVLRLRRRPMGARNLGGWPNRWSRSGPNRAIGNGGGRTCVGERIGERNKVSQEAREKRKREEREQKERRKTTKKNKRIASMHERACLSLSLLDQRLHAWSGATPTVFLVPTCQLTIPKCTREVVRRC
jgi:hypothetical protein